MLKYMQKMHFMEYINEMIIKQDNVVWTKWWKLKIIYNSYLKFLTQIHVLEIWDENEQMFLMMNMKMNYKYW